MQMCIVPIKSQSKAFQLKENDSGGACFVAPFLLKDGTLVILECLIG
jgi:hypothetical protein